MGRGPPPPLGQPVPPPPQTLTESSTAKLFFRAQDCKSGGSLAVGIPASFRIRWKHLLLFIASAGGPLHHGKWTTPIRPWLDSRTRQNTSKLRPRQPVPEGLLGWARWLHLPPQEPQTGNERGAAGQHLPFLSFLPARRLKAVLPPFRISAARVRLSNLASRASGERRAASSFQNPTTTHGAGRQSGQDSLAMVHWPCPSPFPCGHPSRDPSPLAKTPRCTAAPR